MTWSTHGQALNSDHYPLGLVMLQKNIMKMMRFSGIV